MVIFWRIYAEPINSYTSEVYNLGELLLFLLALSKNKHLPGMTTRKAKEIRAREPGFDARQ